MKNLAFDEKKLFYERFKVCNVLNILFLAFTTSSHEWTTGSSSFFGVDWMPDLPVIVNSLLVVLGSRLAYEILSLPIVLKPLPVVNILISFLKSCLPIVHKPLPVVNILILSMESCLPIVLKAITGSKYFDFVSGTLSTGSAQGYYLESPVSRKHGHSD